MRTGLATSMWKTVVAIVLGAGVVAFVSVRAQQKTPRSGALTALDYVEIQQLYSHYAFAYDTASENGDAYAKLFTADGAFTFPHGDPRCVPECKGHAALAVLARGRGNKGPLTLSHVTTNVTIDASPEGARGKAYLALPGPVMRVAGLYEDQIVKTSEGWRFKVRAYTPLPDPQPATAGQTR